MFYFFFNLSSLYIQLQAGRPHWAG